MPKIKFNRKEQDSFYESLIKEIKQSESMRDIKAQGRLLNQKSDKTILELSRYLEAKYNAKADIASEFSRFISERISKAYKHGSDKRGTRKVNG